MKRMLRTAFGVSLCFAVLQIGVAGEASAAGLKVLSDKTVSGFPFPESVGCDAANKVLYVSQFVSALKPTEKDGKGPDQQGLADGQDAGEGFPSGAGPENQQAEGQLDRRRHGFG